MPKFRDIASWQQAEMLMQPAFIRLIDNLRKQLEQSAWEGRYTDTLVWPEGTSEEVKFKVKQLQDELDTASPERAVEIEQVLANLPAPFALYQLHLTHQDHDVTVDLWQVCYQICFQNYDSVHDSVPGSSNDVEIDTSLFDETGDIDWNQLDDKTRQIVEQIFAALPA